MLVRPAEIGDMSKVPLLAHDTWGEGRTTEEHISFCMSSPKYKKGRWFVLEQSGDVLSALICYRNQFSLPDHVIGIGSVATAPQHRKKGYATILLNEVITKHLADKTVRGFFLYSDIDPCVYERLGFLRLPEELQRYKSSVGMIRLVHKTSESFTEAGFKAPDYF